MKKILPEGTKLWMQRGPACSLFTYYPGYAATVITAKQHDFTYKFILAFTKNNMFLWSTHEPDLIELSEKILENEKKDPDYTKKLIADWEVRVKKYYGFCDKLDKTDMSKLSDKELGNLFSEFNNVYFEEYAIPILADAVGFFGEVEMQKLLKDHLKELGKEKDFNKYLATLTQPTEDSFIGEESHGIMLMAQDYIDGKDYSKKLEEHTKKWYWIQNNYLRSIIIDKDQFEYRLKEHAKKPKKKKKKIEGHGTQFDKIKKEKEELIEALELDERTRIVIKMIDMYGIWQDKRKKANLRAQHYLTLFLEEASRRKNIELDNLKFTTPEEIIGLFNGKDLDLDIIKKRRDMVGIIFKPEGVTVYDYEDSKILDKEIEAQSAVGTVNDIYGTVANMGKVRATVKVLSGPEDFDKMNFGDILVTSMTRPEFLPVMRKAGAIITDEGGLTCHAAIVSREFDIPCMVGTKIATRVLEDGMIVEVNANHGFVKVIG